MSQPHHVGEPVDDSVVYLNRELSWLDFAARVLALTEDPDLPLLERAKYLAIFADILDEFFQVRVATLREQVVARVRSTAPDGLDPLAQLKAIRERVLGLVERHTSTFVKEVRPALREAGIRFADWSDLAPEEREHLTREFEERIYPVLTPLAVDPAHPFPYISNLSMNLAVAVRDPATKVMRFARVKVPPVLPRFVRLPDQVRFVPLEQVIAAHLDRLFPGMDVLEHHVFRVTRDTDIELTDEAAEDIMAAMEVVLHERTRSSLTVRLEVAAGVHPSILALLMRELEVTADDVYTVEGPLDLSGLWALYGLSRPELKEKPFAPQVPAALAGNDVDLFRVLQQGDVLVHHPYDSFAHSVEAFLAQAAHDPAVLAIKQTLYRTGGEEAGILGSLSDAAQRGKQVVALVELKARFDEKANIERARTLEQAGAHVVYGIVGLKTHSKILLVVREEADGIRRYCHVGTGNYNPKTANLYEDVGVLTADPEIGADLSELFNHLTGYSRQTEFRRIVVAPTQLRLSILERIAGEARPGGRIVMKMNSLVDGEMIEALYGASRAGCEIDLVIRGICCLRPEVPGLSERIRVRSLIGRYLEHSRIFRFGEPPDAEYLIGSADLMPRNLDRRVEAALRVTEPPLQARLDEVLEVELADDVLAWTLQPDGRWRKVDSVAGLNAQERFQSLAVARAQGRTRRG